MIAATLANAAWMVSAWSSERRFRTALQNPSRAQETLLRRYLQRNANTVFGRRYRFAEIDSIAAYQQRVPLHDYDDLAGQIDRIAAGEQRVLSDEPVRRLIPSSGSTRARKLIPYTDSFQRELNVAIGPWIVSLFQTDPQLMRGCAYWSITPLLQDKIVGQSDKGPPIGFDEDSSYLGGIRKRLVDAVMAVPSDVRRLRNVTTFRLVTLRHLLGKSNLRLISVWHPSFLELLLDTAQEHWDLLVEQIHDQDPTRADELRVAGAENWAVVWPRLRLISCWADAHAAAPAAALGRRLPHVRLQPKGLLATEACVSIPYADRWPLAVRSHFFEFIDGSGAARLADELQLGESYTVVITTGAGLWRYRLHDQVTVEGFVDRTPSIRFIGREDSISDRFGEKLSEGFVGHAIRNTLERCGVQAAFSMLAPEQTSGGWRYTLFVQAAAAMPDELPALLDQALRANPHYDYCRVLGQLQPPAVFFIHGNAYESYARELQNRGMRLGDIKPAALNTGDNWTSIFSSSCPELEHAR